MQAILIYLLKATVCSGILFFYYHIALRNKRFHYYNRFYLLMSVALSLVLPLLNIELWQFNSHNRQVIHLMNVVAVNTTEVNTNSGTFAFSWSLFLLLLYAFITLFMLVAFVFSIKKLYRYKRLYPVERLDNILFINTDLQQAPFSFFDNLFWKNTIDIADATGRQIFKHELTHIEQKHSWDKLFLRLTTLVFWMNPFYWFIQKELGLIHEFIADEKAIENKSAEAFALVLLQSQYGKNIFSPAQSFNYSPIKRRLLMLTTSAKTSYSYVRRIMILPLLAGTILLFAFKLKETRQSETLLHTNAAPPVTSVIITDTSGKTPLYFVDGKETPADDFKKIDASTIESVDVLKDSSAVKQYGERGKNGVVLIKLKKAQSNQSNSAVTLSIMSRDTNVVNATNRALKVIDGKIVSNEAAQKLDPNSIYSISVWKGEEAVKKYGENGRDGVIEITTKESKNETQFTPLKIVKDEVIYPRNDSSVDFTGNTGIHKIVEVKNSDTTGIGEQYEKVFKTVQVPPKFPGGNDAWQKYLLTHLKSDVTTENRAPTGSYTAVVSFIVDVNGNLSDVKAIQDPGFGTGAEAVRVIQRGPKWVPAVQNGHNVTAMTKQAITFRVEEGH